MTTSASAELFLAYIPKDDGTVNALGIVKTYAAGTTTPKATYPTYADALAGTNANSTTINLDATGVVYFWMQGPYKIDIQTSLGASLAGWPKDNIQGAYLTQNAADLVYAKISTPVQVYTTAGSGNAYTLTPTPAITAYTDGISFIGYANHTNTANDPTMNISGLGAVNIVPEGSGGSILKGQLVSGQLYNFVCYGGKVVATKLGASYMATPIATPAADFYDLGSSGNSSTSIYYLHTAAYPNIYIPISFVDNVGNIGGTIDVAYGAGTITSIRPVVENVASANCVRILKRVLTVAAGTTVDTYLTIDTVFMMI